MNTRSTLTRPTTRACLAAMLGAAIVLGSACGDDADAETAMSASACDAYTAMGAAMFGDPAGLPDAATALADGVPEELRDAATVYGDAMVAAMGGDESALDSPAFASSAEEIGSAAVESCDTVATLDVTGVDFAFEGVPDEVDPGRVGIEFTNGTTTEEPHEMLVLKRVGDSDEPVTELLELPEEELFSKVVPMAVTYADEPGGTHHALVDLDAGSYIAICMIPTAGEGPPHAVNGMVSEFSVGGDPS